MENTATASVGQEANHPPPIFLPQPKSIEDTGVDFAQLIDLSVKTIRYGGRLSGGEIANQLCLPFSIVEVLLSFLKREKLIEVVGSQGQGLIEQNYEQVLTDKGYEKATEALERNQYVGPAPVPLAVYVEVATKQSVRRVTVNPPMVHAALADLSLSPSLRRLIGAAVNGGHSILLYGKPGNGKSSVAKRIGKMLGGNILIPYAIDVGGQTIRVYDPRVHVGQEEARADLASGPATFVRPFSERPDRRWVIAERPLVTVGGELSIDDLDLKYSPQTKFYLAPIQILANSGILLIDDFGRQKMRPKDLLNRWIVPMEEGIDHYSLLSGETIEVPFELLLVFSTNLQLERLGDEAFWRRIRHKIEVGDPDEATFLQILRSVCQAGSVTYHEEGANYLLEKHYRAAHRPFRAVHPRDIIGLIKDLGSFEDVQPELTADWIDAACASYFMEEGQKKAA